MPKIDHIFVLMLENRSFDHLFGLLGLPGVNPPPMSFGFKAGATDQLANDPPHSFDDVKAQINDGAMDGFSASGGSGSMRGFSPADVPVLFKLAQDNLLMDNWFSSMPGPTWPNRYFVHAGSSGGLDNDLNELDIFGAETLPLFALQFPNGHIFDRMTTKGVPWSVYRGDSFPQVLSLPGMIHKKSMGTSYFRKMTDFKSDIASNNVAGYTFIEPYYDNFNSAKSSNSMHPLGSVHTGESLIAYIYNTIFTSTIGASSLLVITWDEHGGFFDHVKPPAAVAPGDGMLNQHRAKNPRNFAFDKFGVRVPTLLISPWLPTGLGSTVFGSGQTFDHSSVLRALCSTFNLGSQFTERDKASPDWNDVLRSSPRTLALDLPRAAAPAFKLTSARSIKANTKGPINGNLVGTVQIALDMDMYLAERLGLQPLASSSHGKHIARAQGILTGSKRSAKLLTHLAQRNLLQYLAAVEERDALHDKKTTAKTIRTK